MATVVMAAPARIQTTMHRRWWKCPNCGRTLAEIIGTKLMVKLGARILWFPLLVGTELECPRCGERSELESVP